MDEILSDNQKAWDIAAEEFFEASALPAWGPFGAGQDLNLISNIEGKTFLEIACGSGRSIKYLLENGALKVYGIDISSTQIDEAKRYNEQEVKNRKAVLLHVRMEDKIEIEPVDVVFSVYGFGWTTDPEITLKNIYSYLKPGGEFVWSWDHTFFSDVTYCDGKFIVERSYHDETPISLPNWKKKEGNKVHLTYRKVSTWFQLVRDAGFEVQGYYEPIPQTLDRGSEDPTKYYAIQKAEKVPCTFILSCKKS